MRKGLNVSFTVGGSILPRALKLRLIWTTYNISIR